MNSPPVTLATVIWVLSNLSTTASRPNITLDSAVTSTVQSSPATQKAWLVLIALCGEIWRLRPSIEG